MLEPEPRIAAIGERADMGRIDGQDLVVTGGGLGQATEFRQHIAPVKYHGERAGLTCQYLVVNRQRFLEAPQS